MNFFSLLLLAISCVGVFFVYRIYHQLAQLRSLFSKSFLRMNHQLKKRYDLISDIVETAKTYMKEDREILESVINARNDALQADRKVAENPTNPKAMEHLITAEAKLNNTLYNLLHTFDGCPELKEDSNVQQMMVELSMTNNEICSAQENYNNEVTKYNIVRNKGLPTSMLARVFFFWPGLFFKNKSEQEKKRRPPIS